MTEKTATVPGNWKMRNWKSQVRVPGKIRMQRKLPDVNKSEKFSDKGIINRSQQSCDTEHVSRQLKELSTSSGKIRTLGRKLPDVQKVRSLVIRS